MPKLKTHRGAAKRFKVTGSGRVLKRSGYKSHLLTGKPTKRTRRLRQPSLVSEKEERTIKRLIPYL